MAFGIVTSQSNRIIRGDILIDTDIPEWAATRGVRKICTYVTFSPKILKENFACPLFVPVAGATIQKAPHFIAIHHFHFAWVKS